MSPGCPIGDGSRLSSTKESIQLKQELRLFDGVALIVGCMVGGGIFVTPKAVLQSVGSVGMALVVWVVSGIFSFLGAICYADLGKPYFLFS